MTDDFSGLWPVLQVWLTLAFTALGIKLLDDTLDARQDQVADRPNWFNRYGSAVPIYAIWLFLLATAIGSAWTYAFFCAAYAVGMIGEGKQTALPSAVPDQWRPLGKWFEVILALVIGLILSSWFHLSAALFALLFIQQLDDLLDGEVASDTPLELVWLKMVFYILCSWILYPGVILAAISVSVPIILATRRLPAEGESF